MKNKPSKTYSFLTILTLVSIFGCYNTATKQSITTGPVKEASQEKSTLSSNCDSMAVNNEFSYGALAIEVFKSDTNKIKSLFLNPVIIKMEKQKNDEGGIYYLYDFTDGINKIVLLRNEGFYIEDTDIKNDKVRLNKKISIGMKKDVLLKLLKLPNIKCDTITVKDDELTFECVYTFKGDKLSQIRMGQTVE